MDPIKDAAMSNQLLVANLCRSLDKINKVIWWLFWPGVGLSLSLWHQILVNTDGFGSRSTMSVAAGPLHLSQKNPIKDAAMSNKLLIANL